MECPLRKEGKAKEPFSIKLTCLPIRSVGTLALVFLGKGGSIESFHLESVCFSLPLLAWRVALNPLPHT